jgi:hypothetical protein
LPFTPGNCCCGATELYHAEHFDGYSCPMEAADRRDPNRIATVRGIGVASVRPDGVIAGLTVQHRAEAAAEALSEAARRAHLLEALFRELGLEDEDWVAGSIALREWEEWDESSRREVRRGYIASSRIDVRLTDIARLGRLLAEAAARAEVSVDGPRWEIRPENPAHDEARRRAMADARRRADTYAQAGGLSLGDLLEIVEVGAEQAGRVLSKVYATSLSGYSPNFEMPVHSEGLEIVTGVQVTYALVSR